MDLGKIADAFGSIIKPLGGHPDHLIHVAFILGNVICMGIAAVYQPWVIAATMPLYFGHKSFCRLRETTALAQERLSRERIEEEAKARSEKRARVRRKEPELPLPPPSDSGRVGGNASLPGALDSGASSGGRM